MAASGFEIERKYLLDRMPAIPTGAVRWRIEQGYLSPANLLKGIDPSGAGAAEAAAGAMGAVGGMTFGRLRRTTLDDGSIVRTHTIKTGSGLQRAEREREISEAEFEQHWPRTQGRRLRKTRWRVPHSNVTWEIDDIENGWIVLAEVELAEVDQVVTPPQWLAPHIVREVTDDAAYTNSALSERATSVW